MHARKVYVDIVGIPAIGTDYSHAHALCMMTAGGLVHGAVHARSFACCAGACTKLGCIARGCLSISYARPTVVGVLGKSSLQESSGVVPMSTLSSDLVSSRSEDSL